LQRGADSPVRRRRGAASHAASAHSSDELTAPMQGTIVKVSVSNGDVVEVGDLIVVLEAMKMEQPLTAHRAGTIAELAAEPGQIVAGGSVICEIRD
jgi:acetyl-CoA/propionyl-CoA carboxylase, biotin carboxylase, biotin carboxyl carrier protein